MKRKVVIVEDDPDVLDLLTNTFRKSGEFEVATAYDGVEGLRLVREQRPSALVLDLMLPSMTGLELCRILKSDSATQSLPVLILTAKADEFDRINGFELGADDYITKPFSPREVLLRVKAVIRRAQPAPTSEAGLEAGTLTLDLARHAVTLDGKPIRLTTTEFKLLAALMESRGRVLGRSRLLNEVWGYENPVNTRTVDTHIKRLRSKLGKRGSQILTIRGFGYQMGDHENIGDE